MIYLPRALFENLNALQGSVKESLYLKSGYSKLPGADHSKLWVFCRTYLTQTFLFQLSRPQEILLLNFAKEEN